MKKILIILFVSFSVSVFAATDTLNVVHLNNGVVVRGKIIDRQTETLKIKTTKGEVFIFSNSDIEIIYKEEIPAEDTRTDLTYTNQQSDTVLLSNRYLKTKKLKKNEIKFGLNLLQSIWLIDYEYFKNKGSTGCYFTTAWSYQSGLVLGITPYMRYYSGKKHNGFFGGYYGTIGFGGRTGVLLGTGGIGGVKAVISDIFTAELAVTLGPQYNFDSRYYSENRGLTFNIGLAISLGIRF